MPPNSTIATLRIRIRAGSTNADALSRRFGQLFRRYLRDDLTRLCQRATMNAPEPIQVERMVLDLGMLRQRNLDSDLRTRLREQFEAFIGEHTVGLHGEATPAAAFDRLAERRNNSDIPPRTRSFAKNEEADAASTATDADRGGDGREQGEPDEHAGRTTDRPIAALCAYLCHGAGRVSRPGLRRELNHWLQGVVPGLPSRYRGSLASCCLDHAALTRLRGAFSPATLRALGAWLTQDASGGPVPAPSTRSAMPKRLDDSDASVSDAPIRADHAGEALDTADAAGALVLSAFSYFLRHPKPGLPAPMGDWSWMSDACKTSACRQLLSYPGRSRQRVLDWLCLLDRPLVSSHARLGRSETPAYPVPRPASGRKTAGRPRPPALPADEPLLIRYAGLVLLWPLLPPWFEGLGLLTQGKFVDSLAQARAAACLGLLPCEASVGAEAPAIGKLLCGLAPDASLPDMRLEPSVASQAMDWAQALPAHLPGLSRCSLLDVRELFLQRSGTLHDGNGQRTLSVASDASDVLLREIPWPMRQVFAPWLESPIPVDWL